MAVVDLFNLRLAAVVNAVKSVCDMPVCSKTVTIALPNGNDVTINDYPKMVIYHVSRICIFNSEIYDTNNVGLIMDATSAAFPGKAVHIYENGKYPQVLGTYLSIDK